MIRVDCIIQVAHSLLLTPTSQSRLVFRFVVEAQDSRLPTGYAVRPSIRLVLGNQEATQYVHAHFPRVNEYRRASLFRTRNRSTLENINCIDKNWPQAQLKVLRSSAVWCKAQPGNQASAKRIAVGATRPHSMKACTTSTRVSPTSQIRRGIGGRSHLIEGIGNRACKNLALPRGV